MEQENNPIDRNILSLLSELCQVVRFCRQDAMFCEDVTFSQFMILDQISERGCLNMSELRKILAVDKSTATRLVNPLVVKGLIDRGKSENDSRSVILGLTSAGEDVHKKVWLCLRNFVDAVSAGIPEGKREQTYEAMKTFICAVKNASSACPCCDGAALQESP
jgi:DNA-binding MarR family transcriptional regulator